MLDVMLVGTLMPFSHIRGDISSKKAVKQASSKQQEQRFYCLPRMVELTKACSNKYSKQSNLQNLLLA